MAPSHNAGTWAEPSNLPVKFGVDDGVRTRDFRSHSPALYR